MFDDDDDMMMMMMIIIIIITNNKQTITIRPLFESRSTTFRPRYHHHSTTYVTTAGLSTVDCCTAAISDVTVALMTFDKQSNGRRIEVESYL